MHPIGFVEYLEALGPDGSYGRWLRSKSVAVAIAGTVFLHGGLSRQNDAVSVKAMNDRAGDEISRFDQYRAHLISRDVILEYSTFREILAAVALELRAWTTRLFPGPPAPGSNPPTLTPEDRAHLEVPLLFRHWDHWVDHHYNHVLVVDTRTGRTVDLTPGPHDAPPISLGSDLDIAWSPDGREIHHSETEMLRYLRRLQARDVALDRSMIALGSCTMKLNATTEMIPVTWPEFAAIHPFAPAEQTRGYARLLARLEAQLMSDSGGTPRQKLTCRSCHVRFLEYICPKCQKVADQCQGCHADTCHGAVLPL